MKSLIASAILLWTVLCLEVAFMQSSDWFSQGALLIPVTCAIVFWMRNAVGIAITTIALLFSWLAFPVGPPIVGLAMPLIAAWLLSPPGPQQSCRRTGWLQRCCPAPLHLPLFTVALILLQQIACVADWRAEWHQAAIAQQIATSLDQLLQVSAIAIPISAGLSLLIFVADELGLRRRATDVFL